MAASAPTRHARRRCTSCCTSRKSPTTRATWGGRAWPWGPSFGSFARWASAWTTGTCGGRGWTTGNISSGKRPTTGRRCGPGCGSGRLWLFSKHATRPYTDAAFRPGDALVFGGESRGLPPSLLAQDPSGCLRIPMRAEARSLNLAVSVAVAAFEALRQFGPSLWPCRPA